MKKLVVGVLVLALSILNVPTAYAVDTNNFTVSSYDVQMTLGRDSDNRSTLSVKETITAEFPDFDQNHGPERVFVKDYNGHSVSLDIVSVTDENGSALNYHWDGDTMRIGDSDIYVHGTQIYVITYTMRDVTRYYSDTGRDEFYWDVIGADSQVPIQSASVRVTIDPPLAALLTGNSTCYRGAMNSIASCELTRAENVYATQVDSLQPGEGVTVAIGFKQGTFAAYQQSFMEKIVAWWFLAQFIVGPIAVIVLIWFMIRWYGRIDRRKELGTIVPEYLPPKDASVTTAARIGGYRTSVMTAQMLDFAVRHYIKIYEVKEKTLFFAAQYEVEVIQGVTVLQPEEQELLKDTFGGLPSPGSRLNLKELQNNPSYYQRTLNNEGDLDKLIRGDYGLRELDDATKRWARRIARVSLIIGIVTLSFLWLLAAGVMFGMSFIAYRLTNKGLALKRYLEGLKMYIEVAEEDRIKMLQSPEGAEKVRDVASGTDSAQLIKLYERVLPYAVLFGQEKEWNKQLGSYYETANTAPDWYTGQNAVFNAVVFSSAMNSFSQSSSAASSYSSSSGGSGGGGFSGGGGGGGGVGGW